MRRLARACVIGLAISAQACVQQHIERGRGLIAACEEGNAARVREMLAADASLASYAYEHRSRGGRSLHWERPLPHCAGPGSLDIVRMLLAGGADPNGVSINGSTPLEEAVRAGNWEVVEVLLKSGSDARQGNLLHAAASNDRPEMTRLLLDRGADVNAYWEGETPLHRAASAGSVGVVAVLCGAGADPMKRGRSGHTPVQAARVNTVIAFLRPGGPCAELLKRRAHGPVPARTKRP